MDDTSQYSYILYIIPGDSACDLAVKAIPMHTRIQTVNVKTLKTKPSWLVGVPTLYRPADKTSWKGTECIETLHNYIQWLHTHMKLQWSDV